jgi:DNA-binding CsgD family transcriptional regulator
MFDEALVLTRAVLATASREGVVAVVSFPLAIQGGVLWRIGQWDAAIADLQAAATLASQTRQSTDTAHAHAVLSLVTASQGDEVACRAAAGIALRASEAACSYATTATTYTALGILYLGLGRAEEAFEHLQQAAALCHRLGLLALGHWQWAPELVECHVRLGDPADAEAVMEVLAEFSQRTRQAMVLAMAERCQGLLASEDRFEEHFHRALAHHAQADRPFEEARTRLCFGERLRRAKKRRAARVELQQALESFVALGAISWSVRTRAELEATGRYLAHNEPSVTGVLTPQELQVALAVADGLTNREVAAKLFLSQKTVEYHLSHVFRKVEVSDRNGLRQRLKATN